jgi:hypothetical protein
LIQKQCGVSSWSLAENKFLMVRYKDEPNKMVNMISKFVTSGANNQTELIKQQTHTVRAKKRDI